MTTAEPGTPDQSTDGAEPRPAMTSAGRRRPALDGLRAVAVYLVVGFHVGADRLVGGFIGVDVFFVLSGYLVTQVLLRDVDARGSVRYGRFYARRVRRLLPASLLTLGITALVYSAVASPEQVEAARSALRASLLYVANWFFVRDSTGYFDAGADRNPFLHFWSLAVEEQFYVLWPLLLGALVWSAARFGVHRRLALRTMVATGIVASASWAMILRVDSPDRAYFGTDTRAYQLLAGALLALCPSVVRWSGRRRVPMRFLAPVSLAAIVLLATDVLSLDPIERGIAVTVATCALLVSLESGILTSTTRALASRSVGYLGRISYGTYLWHWPTILVIEQLTDVSPLPLAAVVSLLATGLASLSYHLVEVPIRGSRMLDRFRWPVAVSGVAVSVLAAVLVVPAITPTPEPDVDDIAADQTNDAFTPVPASFDNDDVYFRFFGDTVDCTGGTPQDCTVVTGSGAHILLMGDSNAQMWIPAFTQLAEDEDLTLSLSVTPGCLWQRNVYKLTEKVRKECLRTKEDAYERVIPALRPDLIVLVNAEEQRGERSSTYVDDPVNEKLRVETPASLETLGELTDHILIIEPSPQPTDSEFNPRECLSEAEIVEECRFVAPTEPTWIELLERDLAAADDAVTSVDFDQLVCPFFPICDPMVGDITVFWNGKHVTERYSRTLAEPVATYLREQGLLDG